MNIIILLLQGCCEDEVRQCMCDRWPGCLPITVSQSGAILVGTALSPKTALPGSLGTRCGHRLNSSQRMTTRLF